MESPGEKWELEEEVPKPEGLDGGGEGGEPGAPQPQTTPASPGAGSDLGLVTIDDLDGIASPPAEPMTMVFAGGEPTEWDNPSGYKGQPAQKNVGARILRQLAAARDKEGDADFSNFGSNLGDAGAAMVANFLILHPRSLYTLNLSCQSITKSGMLPLAAGLQERGSALEAVDLSDNPLQDDGVLALADALPSVHCLESLDVSGVGMSDVGARFLLAALVQNTSIRRIDVTRNLLSRTLTQALHMTAQRRGSVKTHQLLRLMPASMGKRVVRDRGGWLSPMEAAANERRRKGGKGKQKGHQSPGSASAKATVSRAEMVKELSLVVGPNAQGKDRPRVKVDQEENALIALAVAAGWDEQSSNDESEAKERESFLRRNVAEALRRSLELGGEEFEGMPSPIHKLDTGGAEEGKDSDVGSPARPTTAPPGPTQFHPLERDRTELRKRALAGAAMARRNVQDAECVLKAKDFELALEFGLPLPFMGRRQYWRPGGVAKQDPHSIEGLEAAVKALSDAARGKNRLNSRMRFGPQVAREVTDRLQHSVQENLRGVESGVACRVVADHDRDTSIKEISNSITCNGRGHSDSSALKHARQILGEKLSREEWKDFEKRNLQRKIDKQMALTEQEEAEMKKYEEEHQRRIRPTHLYERTASEKKFIEQLCSKPKKQKEKTRKLLEEKYLKAVERQDPRTKKKCPVKQLKLNPDEIEESVHRMTVKAIKSKELAIKKSREKRERWSMERKQEKDLAIGYRKPRKRRADSILGGPAEDGLI